MNELICLDEEHQALAYHIAAARDIAARIQNREPGRNTYAQGTEGALAINVEGASAEVAFWVFTHYQARVNGVILLPKLKDIEADAIWHDTLIEVRATEHRDGHLLVYPKDKPESVYVLCIRNHPEYRFPGYLRGKDAQIGAYLRHSEDRGSSYWVPQDHLSRWR